MDFFALQEGWDKRKTEIFGYSEDNCYICRLFVGRSHKFVTFNLYCTMAEYLQPEKKQEIFAKYGKSNKDTGSPESQVALFSYRIAHLTEHVKKNKKDVATRRSLLRLVSKRRQLLNYLQKVDIERYRAIVKELGLRR